MRAERVDAWSRGGRVAVAALALLAAACDRTGPTPAPALPDDGEAAIAALIAHCHGPLRGMDRVLLELRSSAGEPPLTCLLAPGRMRVDHPDGRVEFLVPRGAWRCAAGRDPVRLEGDDHRRLVALRGLLGSICLEPLLSRTAVARRGPTVFAVTAATGSTWRLELDPTTRLPSTLSGEPGTLVILDYLDTGVSRLPAAVQLADLGSRLVRFVANDLVLDDFVFHDPTARPDPNRPRLTPAAPGGEARPRSPQLETIDGGLYLVIDDPGGWAERAARIVDAGTRLGAQGQIGQPLPYLYELDGRPLIGIPFVPDDQQGSPPFHADRDQDVQRRPAHRALVVYRPHGPVADALRDGPASLAKAAAERRLRASGPLRVIPYVAWEDGPPSAERLGRMAVRFELPVDGEDR